MELAWTFILKVLELVVILSSILAPQRHVGFVDPNQPFVAAAVLPISKHACYAGIHRCSTADRHPRNVATSPFDIRAPVLSKIAEQTSLESTTI